MPGLHARQSPAHWEFRVGLLQAGKYTGRKVVVQGWCRRSPIPYAQIKTTACDGEVKKS